VSTFASQYRSSSISKNVCFTAIKRWEGLETAVAERMHTSCCSVCIYIYIYVCMSTLIFVWDLLRNKHLHKSMDETDIRRMGKSESSL
jgi:hypothetical protein